MHWEAKKQDLLFWSKLQRHHRYLYNRNYKVMQHQILAVRLGPCNWTIFGLLQRTASYAVAIQSRQAISSSSLVTRVKNTDRNRSGLTGNTDLGQFRFRPSQIGLNSKFKFEFQKIKNSQKFLKILQVATNLILSNFFKYSFIQYTLRAFKVK